MNPTLPNTAIPQAPDGRQSDNVSPVSQPMQQYGNISVHGPGLTIVGDLYNSGTVIQPQTTAQEVTKFGLCLGAAPQIESASFVGRAAEIDEIYRNLHPRTMRTNQQRVALGGMGGVGKTQLAIAYTERHQENYDSIFWLNATSELTLQASLRLVAGHIVKAQDLESLNDEQVLARVREWLLNRRNTRWLLIYDNYDEPTQFDISRYCPYTSHGSVIITTRLPDHIQLSCNRIRIQPLSDIEESLDILRQRSKRQNVDDGKYTILCE